MYKCDGLPSIHDAHTLRKWIQLIGKEVGLELNNTLALMKRVYKITNAIINKVKKLRKQGGRQMKNYLEKDWEIHHSPSDIKSNQQIVIEAK